MAEEGKNKAQTEAGDLANGQELKREELEGKQATNVVEGKVQEGIDQAITDAANLGLKPAENALEESRPQA